MQNASAIASLSQVPTDILTSSGGRLEDRIRIAQNSSGHKQKNELKKVSQEFEAIFLSQMLKVMRETIEESGLFGSGFGKSVYTELFDQEISLSMARRGALGISDLLNSNISEPEAGNSAEPGQSGKIKSDAETPATPPPSIGFIPVG